MRHVLDQFIVILNKNLTFNLIEEELEFQKYDEVYIYGAAYKQQMLYKLLKNSKKINIPSIVFLMVDFITFFFIFSPTLILQILVMHS